MIWCGTLPGGLFKSEDGGDSWALNRPLWDDPRREQWFGGGADQPGIHSICVDPRDARHVKIGVSCGGVWTTRDGGKTWPLTAKGMRAEFMPPDKQYEENVQDPHLVAQCRSESRRAVGPASQRHLQVRPTARRRGRRSPASAVDVWIRRRRPSERSRHRVVRARHERREALPGRWPRGRQAHARRRQDLRDDHARPAAATCLRSRLSPRARRR